MTYLIHSRRDFIRNGTIAALAVPLSMGCKNESFASDGESDILALIRKNANAPGTEGMGAIDVPDSVTSQMTFSTKVSDGEPIIISGRVYEPDGATPAPNTLIYFYHTDKFGIYGRTGEPRHGQYRGWMLSDAKGGYEFASIRPASYPNSTISQHVHMTVTGVDFREDWIDSILFERDSFITQTERERAGKRGGFDPIIRLKTGPDGIHRGTRNIRLMKS